MRKIILTLLLAAMNTGAMAEWVKVASNDSLDIYADPTTIRKNRNMVKMWTLSDLREPRSVSSTGPQLSTMHRVEFDCADERKRYLSIAAYSGQMGSGIVVYSSTQVGEWIALGPNTVGASELQFACGKTKLK